MFDGACRRCGRRGHKPENCSATVHMVQEYAAQTPVEDEDYDNYEVNDVNNYEVNDVNNYEVNDVNNYE
eukprot:8397984-Heterocapsa_arctica.AAC.1